MNLSFYSDWFDRYTTEMRTRVPLRQETAETETPGVVSSLQSILDEFDMKVAHTRLVQARCEDIARWLCLSEQDFTMASLCGLFHDLGRFEQAVLFGTMDDHVTGSHAVMSEKIFLREVPRDGLNQREVEVIAAALRCHAMYRLPGDLTEDALLFTKLTRDADKLDIFRHVLDLKYHREKRVFRMVTFDEAGCFTPALYEAVMRGENINAALVHTKEDRMLLEISLIYDLNFGLSFTQTLDMRFMEKLTDLQPSEGTPVEDDKQALVALCAYVNDYMRARVQQR